MTVVVAFLCTNGVVVAADSMLTPTIGNLAVGHHKGVKVELLPGNQIFAYAGDQGQGARFKFIAEGRHDEILRALRPIDYSVRISKEIIEQLDSTGISLDRIDVATILAFIHDGKPHCCIFEGPLQPRLLDSRHYYAALGTGKQFADPFLRFLIDTFCQHGQPNVADARFLATWTLRHVIDTNPGGVADPIKMAVIETSPGHACRVWELNAEDLGQHEEAIESATKALSKWLDDFRSTAITEGTPDMPTSPTKS